MYHTLLQSLPVAVIAVTFMAVMSIVFFFPATPTTDTPNMNYTVVLLIGVLVLSLMWYYFPVYGGVHWFTGPVRNIGTDDERAEDVYGTDMLSVEKVVGTSKV